MRSDRLQIAWGVALLFAVAVLGACGGSTTAGGDGGSCTRDSECPGGVCVEGRCVPLGGDADVGADADADADADAVSVCERVTSAAGIAPDAASSGLSGISSEACPVFHLEGRTWERAPDGDSVCSGKDDCFHSSGTPEGGCPNTCSCVCVCGLCFKHSCTLVGGCTEPPVYR